MDKQKNLRISDIYLHIRLNAHGFYTLLTPVTSRDGYGLTVRRPELLYWKGGERGGRGRHPNKQVVLKDNLGEGWHPTKYLALACIKIKEFTKSSDITNSLQAIS